jgi:Sel1 repeat
MYSLGKIIDTTAPTVDVPVPLDFGRALHFYSMSSHKGNLLATHRISASLSNEHLGAKSAILIPPGMTACTTAVGGFRTVAESDITGVHLSPFSSKKIVGLTAALDAYNDGDYEKSIGIFLELAALGIESAQTNAAILLTKKRALKGRLPLSESKKAEFKESVYESIALKENEELSTSSSDSYSTAQKLSEEIALNLFVLASAQGNLEAYLQMGDMYYYGRAGLSSDKLVALTHYQAGADLRHPHALFNLAVMYEVGDGVPQVKPYFSHLKLIYTFSMLHILTMYPQTACRISI